MTQKANTYGIPDDDWKFLSECARRVEVALWRRNWEHAHQLVDQAHAAYDQRRGAAISLDDRLHEIRLDARLVTILWNNRIRTVGQLLRCPRDEFELLPQLGPDAWDRCVAALRRHGFRHGVTPRMIRRYARDDFRILQPGHRRTDAQV